MDRVLGAAVLVGTFATTALISACSDDDHAGSPPHTDGGARVDGGDGDGDGDGDGGPTPDGPVSSLGPTVALLSPTEPAAGDFSIDAIVVDGRFSALCRVTRNPDTDEPIDSTSVVLTAFSGDLSYDVAATPTSTADEYEANLDVGDFPNGPLAVRCTASDAAAEPHTNSDEIATFLDLGPEIDPLSPIQDQSYGQQVDISFTVTEAPVAEDDTLGELAEVTVQVGTETITADEVGGGNYFAALDFDDPIFDPALAGPVQISITATDTRGVERTSEIQFIADSNGPVILISAPEPGELVGGFVTISATVSDSASIDSVIATVAHEFEIELLSAGGNNYERTFDARVLDRNWVFPLLEVRARDLAGNESSVGRVIALDTRPPIVTLNSPLMRLGTCITVGLCEEDDQIICTEDFDPLGADSADDGELVGALIELRTRTEDQGNGALAPSGVFVPMAGVDQEAVEFLVLDDTTLSLVVDTDGDTICDAINPAITPTTIPQASNEAAVVSLQPVPPGGDAHLAIDDDYGFNVGLADERCISPAENEDFPPPLCLSTPATIAVSDSLGEDPAIYSIPPFAGQNCLGNAFDAPASNISDGWACVVGVAPDGLGNIGVSAPLRICVDHDGDGVDADGNGLADIGCPGGFGEVADPSALPACSDGCTMPAGFVEQPWLQMVVIDTVAACDDGLDNDFDGPIDLDDPECLSSGDDNEAE